MKKNKCIIMYGPTGVGKTECSLTLGLHQNIEIINGDAGQFYEPLSIGTAKPDWKREPVAHHLFDIIKKPLDCTVTRYRSMVFEKMHELWNRGSLPVIVGGAGFYIKSLFFPPLSCQNNQKDEESGTQQSRHGTTQELWKYLKTRDSHRADALYKQDRYRIERALTLLDKGVLPSLCIPTYEPFDAQVLLIFLTRDRQELYDRVNKRVLLMFDKGWLQEVESLLATDWEPFLMRKKLIGYSEVLQYLHSGEAEGKKKLLIETIQKKTRHYVKRQLTFWAMLEKLMNQHFSEGSRAVEIFLSGTQVHDTFKTTVQNFLKDEL